MDLQLCRSSLNGTVSSIPSKSALHRLLICSSLSDSPTYIDFSASSKDIDATLQCISAIGCNISTTDTGVQVHPAERLIPHPHLDCLECGSTLRFMLPVAASLFDDYSVTGHGRLKSRPLNELVSSMQAHGCVVSSPSLPFCVKGRLRSGIYKIPGNVSSQYISGLMLALPLLEGDSHIVLTSPLSSAAYLEMTLDTQRLFGIEITQSEAGWYVRGSQKYKSPGTVSAEGDWSSAACWLCAGALSGPITVTGLCPNSAQADTAILGILRSMGARVYADNNTVTVSRGELKPLSIDVDQFPDLMPVIAMTLSMCPGESLLYNAARLRLKESDRISAIAETLSAVGVTVIEGPDYLKLVGASLRPGRVSGSNDHRIVMAAALACMQTSITIIGADAVEKSYPGFFSDYAALGGKFSKE